MNRPIKIAVAGTHSTGKTTFLSTLCRALNSAGLTVATVCDLAEEAASRGLAILSGHTPQSTLWIMSRGITLELEVGLRADVVLVDRPVPDALGYLRAALAYRDEACPKPYADYLLRLAGYHAATYDLIFKTVLDPTIPLGDDKPRDADPRFRAMADTAISDVFADLQLAHRPLTPDGHDNAVQQVIGYLPQLDRLVGLAEDVRSEQR